ncbi:lazarillo protein-like [Schistocerca nitens]|uniref:lazarillo protein-like n=1 Tax=Schistocerca nitens TaxID=7011 RepID=UPI002119363A|nr:lazarillo protein-like [Schistocerca nitens]
MAAAAMYHVAVLALALLAPPSLSQKAGLGPCPEVDVMPDFNVSAYLGKWYEQYRYFAIFEGQGDCVTATYSDSGDGVVTVENTANNPNTGITETIKGTANLASDGSDGRLLVSFPLTGSLKAPYWILDTDYDSYSVVWSCSSLANIANAQFSWLLTRDKNPSSETIQRMFSVLDKNNLETKSYIKTNQNCNN